MSKLEEEFYRRMPAAQLEVSYLRPEKVYQAVADDKVDLGLVSYPESTREVVALPWRDEPMVVACAPTHALAARSTVAADELEHIDFIGFDEDLPISRDIERFLKERRVQVRVTMHFDNIQSMKEALRLGHAISILPAPMLKDDEQKGLLRSVQLEEPLFRPLGIIQRRRRSVPRAAQIFLEMLRETAV
jgi:DNA-binding transcriptional LysR family regulator